MTKERKLAIEMWKGIRDKIQSSFASDHSITEHDIIMYKNEFCCKHGLRWRCCCWFCQYIPMCIKCPLRSCMRADSLYFTVIYKYSTLHARIEACDKIIAALEEA